MNRKRIVRVRRHLRRIRGLGKRVIREHKRGIAIAGAMGVIVLARHKKPKQMKKLEKRIEKALQPLDVELKTFGLPKVSVKVGKKKIYYGPRRDWLGFEDEGTRTLEITED